MHIPVKAVVNEEKTQVEDLIGDGSEFPIG